MQDKATAVYFKSFKSKKQFFMLFSSGKQNVKTDKEIILYYPRFVAVLRLLTGR